MKDRRHTRRHQVRRTPDGMPVLRGGKHRRPEDGSCLMEYVSVLAGERFSDRPRCTAPVLARLARHANDRLRPEIVGGRRRREVRRALLPLAPGLIDAGSSRVVRPVVLDHLTAAGMAVTTRDRALRRVRHRALTHRLGLAGPVRRSWLGARMVLDTPAAFLRVRYLLQALPPKERNAAWIGLLTDVVDDLAGVAPAREAVPAH